MADYIFEGKTFKHPDKIVNERVISVSELEESTDKSAWYLDKDIIPKMMRLLLDGPHDEIDWLQQEMPLCVGAYQSFFLHCTEKIAESMTLSPSG